MTVPYQALLKVLGDAAAGAAAGYVRSLNPLGSLIRVGSLAGLSGRQVLSDYRAIGGTITNATYWNLRKSVMQGPIAGGNMTSLLAGDRSAIQELTGGRAGVYRYDFTVHVMRVGPSGDREFTTQSFTILQKDFDPAAAMQTMGQLMGSHTDAESDYGKWLGFELQGVGQYTGASVPGYTRGLND